MIDNGQRVCEYSLLLVDFGMHRRKGSRNMAFVLSVLVYLNNHGIAFS